MPKVLVIDDNQAILNFLNVFLLQSGKFEIQTLQDSRKAFEYLDKADFDVLLLDMDMPNVTGLDVLKYIKEKEINITTIVLTGVEDIDLAISAMKLGTFDYMLKPVNEEKLLATLNSVVKKKELYKTGAKFKKPSFSGLEHKEAFSKIITQNDEMINIFHYVEKFAATDNSILIWGESGSGKELIAEAIHKISNRRNKKFVAVNAGTFANELFSSEFFGYEKGAFTGAEKNKTGFIEEADGGTLFLDEIGELSLPIQVKLLRVLQEEEFYKLGSTKNLKVDLRIIVATNKNLFEEINTGNFRKDLFFRLNINSIKLPPLRNRKEDIALLANYFLKKFNKKYNKEIKKISKPVINCLKNYSFPGNVRELMNLINSAIVIESSNEIQMKSLPGYCMENMSASTDLIDDTAPSSLKEVEKNHLRKVLSYTNGNKSKAAKILGISRVTLLSKIKQYKIID
ncbi:MAG: sigma-54-dependent Fis family transcriptional regulator [Bacteroidetes bacterium]|nr:sigma-54-dependent Fis family transcriptional regulator [Bacteroidota bacterium]